MRLELQDFLFESEVSRRDLLNYVPQAEKKYNVQVFRNHSFELVEHTIGAYLDYGGLGVQFSYSGYDDSFSFTELDPSANLILLWVDTTRYNDGAETQFLHKRLEQLRLQYLGPVLLIPFGKDITLSVTGVTIFNLTSIKEELQNKFTDERARSITGTPLSAKAMLAISRELGLRYFPALLSPTLKAIIVDLDNTLYRGVLGEDGAQALVLSPGHRRLQDELKTLADAGFFLCVASKNQAEDVDELFKIRKDFPLRDGDFSKILASWDSKADSIEKIARFLNIDPSSMVFIDDNIGELTAVQMAFPSIKLIHASEDGDITCNVLKEFPGLLKMSSSGDDVKRKEDVQANEQRQFLQKKLSTEEYIRSLEICLKFSYDDKSQISRISELANKTNQFIFNYMRYTEADIERRMQSEEYLVVTISLSDKLSDSGLIGVCVGHALSECVEIEECFVSCRALGRGIDDMIVLGAISGIVVRMKRTKVKIDFRKGERNLPAQRLVEQCLSAYIERPGEFSFHIPADLVNVEVIEH